MSFSDRDGFIWMDGKMVDWRDAQTHFLTSSLHYGNAVFEGIRAYETASAGTCIILDPPKYGRGPKGEFWRIEDDLTPLLQKCRQLLSEEALFMVLTIYAIRASSLAAHYALADLFDNQGGCLESGELAIQEAPLKSGKTDLSRYVAQANFARWCSDIAA